MAWLSRVLGALSRRRRWGGVGSDADLGAALRAELEGVLRLNSIGQQRRYVRAFEHRFAAHLGLADAVGMNSGTSALYFALKALGVGPGDEVVTVANTWISTLTAVRETGAECRFADLDPASGQMDPDALETAITERTRVLLPVHMYGIAADMPRLSDIAERHGLAVVEDACQGIGAHCGGAPAGTFGTLGCFSFHANKLVGAPADGGMVVGRDPALLARVRAMAEANWSGDMHEVQTRIPSRLPPLAIPVLKAKLARLDERVAARKAQFEVYRDGLANAAGLDLLAPGAGAVASHRCCVLIASEPRMAAHVLGRAGWVAEPMYKQSVALLESLLARGIDLPVTERLLRRQLLLPIGPEVTTAQQHAVLAALSSLCVKHAA